MHTLATTAQIKRLAVGSTSFGEARFDAPMMSPRRGRDGPGNLSRKHRRQATLMPPPKAPRHYSHADAPFGRNATAAVAALDELHRTPKWQPVGAAARNRHSSRHCGVRALNGQRSSILMGKRSAGRAAARAFCKASELLAGTSAPGERQRASAGSRSLIDAAMSASVAPLARSGSPPKGRT